MGDAADARRTLEQHTDSLVSHLRTDLLGSYLFGSLARGGFYPGKSDLDLMAVTATSVEEGEQLDVLRTLHDAFVSERPDWVERVEVSYVALDALRTFGDRMEQTLPPLDQAGNQLGSLERGHGAPVESRRRRAGSYRAHPKSNRHRRRLPPVSR